MYIMSMLLFIFQDERAAEFVKSGKKSIILAAGAPSDYRGLCSMNIYGERIIRCVRDIHHYADIYAVFDNEDFKSVYPTTITQQAAISIFRIRHPDAYVQAAGGINAYIISHVDDV
jgi:ASC-1-like (ASCH) protein